MRSRNDDGDDDAESNDDEELGLQAGPSFSTWIVVGLGAVALIACSLAAALFVLRPVGGAPVAQPKPIVAPPAPLPTPQRDWLHISRESSRLGNVEIRIAAARHGRKTVRVENELNQKGIDLQPGEPLLELVVVVANTSKTRIQDFDPWVPTCDALDITHRPRRQCRLVDNFDNRYDQIPDHYRVRISGQLRAAHQRIRPGDTVGGSLLFEKLLPNAEWFQLELDNAAFDGETGITKFRIPASSITWDKP